MPFAAAHTCRMPAMRSRRLSRGCRFIVTLLVALQQTFTVQTAAPQVQVSAQHLAAPWLAPASVQFPYEGLHNSAQQLVAVQSGGSGRVAVTFFTAAHQPMLLNHVYSMVKYGLVRAAASYAMLCDTATQPWGGQWLDGCALADPLLSAQCTCAGLHLLWPRQPTTL